MGQYFILVNLDKKEYVCPWCMGGAAKLYEWCANPQAGVIPFLLRKSSDFGGGDIHKDYETAGRWAGDRIVLVGDYDISGLFDLARGTYRNITWMLVRDFNDFMGEEILKFKPCWGCKSCAEGAIECISEEIHEG